jgi:hypothetical protein
MKKLSLIFFLLLAFSGMSYGESNNDQKLHELECMNKTFDKFIEIFGVYVVGTTKAPIHWYVIK